MNIDLELFKLILKYNIFDTDPDLLELYASEYFADTVRSIFESIPEGKKVAIRGNGLHTAELIKCLEPSHIGKISLLIDKDFGFLPDRLDVPIILPEAIKYHDIDIIILSTFKWRNDFMIELMGYLPQIEIIDPYDICARDGLIFNDDFYRYTEHSHRKVSYIDTSLTYKKYLSENNEEQKEFYLQRLIAYLSEIKDFITLNKILRLYIDNGYEYANRMENYMYSLDILFDEVRRISRARSHKTIGLYWIDCCHRDELEETEFGQICKNETYYFENAYVNSPWTHDVMNMIMFEKLPISGKTYIPQKYMNDAPFLKMLRKHGYRFRYYANPGMYQGYFEDSKIPYKCPKGFEGPVLGTRNGAECSTRLLWNSLKEIILDDTDQCHLIHIMTEPHPPHLFSLADPIKNRRSGAFSKKEELGYISDLLLWYQAFDPPEMIRVYFSDHGETGIKPYSDRMTHIFLCISGINKVQKETRLYSHISFCRLIDGLCGTSEINEVFSDYVLYENVDFGSFRGIVEYAILPTICGEGRYPTRFLQCRGVRTVEDLYVKYATGKELYFKLPDEQTDLAGDERYMDRIIRLRQLCSEEFIDIGIEPLFKDSHYLYDLGAMIPDYSIEW